MGPMTSIRRNGVSHLVGFLCFVGIMLLGTGCQAQEEPASDITVTWQVTPEPPQVGPLTVVVTLADSTARPVQASHVALEGTMTHPGMQPVLAVAREVAPGQYEAELDLTMGGDWILLLDATLADGRTIRRQREVREVRAP